MGQICRAALGASLWLVGCASTTPAPSQAGLGDSTVDGEGAASIERAGLALTEGQRELDRGRVRAAVDYAESYLAELGKHGQLGSDSAAELYSLLGQARMAENKVELARGAFEKQLAILKSRAELGETGALALQRLAMTHTMEQRFAPAEALLKESLMVRRGLVPNDPLAVAASLGELANVYVQTSRLEEARALIRAALPLVKPGSQAQDARIFQLQMTLAESFRYGSAWPEAVDAFSKAVQVAQRNEAAMAPRLVDAWSRLADTQERIGRIDAAVASTERAIELALRTTSLIFRALELAKSAARLRRQLEPSTPMPELLARYGVRARTLEDGRIVDGEIEQVEASPKGKATPAPGARPSGNVSNAARIVAGMRAGFRACYNTSLATRPGLAGHIKLTLRVASSGLVQQATAVSVVLPLEVIDCVLSEAGGARFEAPEGGFAVISVPVTFVPR